MRGGTVRATTAAGVLSIVMLSALGPSIAAAFEAAEDQPSPAARLEPIGRASEPNPPQAPPPQATPPHPTPTPKPKPKPAPTPTPKPKPKPTPLQPAPGDRMPGEQTPSQQGPGGQVPGDPNPVRSDEPPAAPVIPDPGTAGGSPPGGGEPGAPAGQPGEGPGPTATTGQGAPLPGVGPRLSRVHLVVAGATVSGIAAVTGWLVLGGRRRDRAPVPVARPSGTTVTLADDMQIDLAVVVNRPEGAARPRYSRRVPAGATTTLWRDDDDRPRWLRRLDEQRPARPRVPRSSPGPDDDAMPWLAAVTWTADDDSGEE